VIKQVLAMRGNIFQDAAIKLFGLRFKPALWRAKPDPLIPKPRAVIAGNSMNRMSFRHQFVSSSVGSIENSAGNNLFCGADRN
jgi:hypothetical protein